MPARITRGIKLFTASSAFYHVTGSAGVKSICACLYLCFLFMVVCLVSGALEQREEPRLPSMFMLGQKKRMLTAAQTLTGDTGDAMLV